VLTGAGAEVRRSADGALLVSELDGTAIGRLATSHDIPLSELTPHRVTLEEAFMDLTRESLEYVAEQGGNR
jgi:ABC-2 type transport system ATP-binding protein